MENVVGDCNEDDDNNDDLEIVNPDHSDPPVPTKIMSGTSKEPGPSEKPKLLRLPLSRVKGIMKMDPDCHIISQDALVLVAKATELFLESLARETVKCTINGKRKTILKKDLDMAIDVASNLCFLDGILEHI